MKKELFIVTHGDKFDGPNPKMTAVGFEQVAKLACLLPVVPSLIVSGTGARHLDVLSALDFDGKIPVRITSAIGGPESLEIREGGRVIVLADGTEVPSKSYTTLPDTARAAEALLRNLPDKTVVCAGRPSMIMLGLKDAKSASVYKVTVTDEGNLKYHEVLETGVSEEGTV